jgi:hypothetical protein
LRSCKARFTFLPAFFPYRAINLLRIVIYPVSIKVSIKWAHKNPVRTSDTSPMS